MLEIDYSFDGINIKDCFIFMDGDEVINKINKFYVDRSFEEFDFEVTDNIGEKLSFKCLGASILEKDGKRRLYFAVSILTDEEKKWYPTYIVKDNDGKFLLVKELDELMMKILKEALLVTEEDSSTNNKKKKGKIALKIIIFPFWLIWQILKLLIRAIFGFLKLFVWGLGVVFGSDKSVQAFVRGLKGEEEPLDEYTFVNSMGCTQTVYSSNGRDFYDSNGAYVGSSEDGGKTIIEK